jgi:hypothetical protein
VTGGRLQAGLPSFFDEIPCLVEYQNLTKLDVVSEASCFDNANFCEKPWECEMTLETETELKNAENSEATDNTNTTSNSGINNYTDGFAYEVPRPFLTLQQAAAVLGKSLRSLERSLIGRWGNKLPEGWSARRMKTDEGDEWRILPPPGFRLRQVSKQTSEGADTGYGADELERIEGIPFVMEPSQSMNKPQQQRRQQPWRPDRHTMDQPTIVIDRTEEVEHLLRDLVACQRALAEERRLHMEDLRMITQLQGSMRLLEAGVSEQNRVKSELEAAKQELNMLKEQYNQIISAPWWKRLFKGGQ